MGGAGCGLPLLRRMFDFWSSLLMNSASLALVEDAI
jgi:hypothetical protein